jgi:hypothetical protein
VLVARIEDAQASTNPEGIIKAGARFAIEPGRSPFCRLAVDRDPDGNAVAIHKRSSG